MSELSSLFHKRGIFKALISYLTIQIFAFSTLLIHVHILWHINTVVYRVGVLDHPPWSLFTPKKPLSDSAPAEAWIKKYHISTPPWVRPYPSGGAQPKYCQIYPFLAHITITVKHCLQDRTGRQGLPYTTNEYISEIKWKVNATHISQYIYIYIY